ncbi:MAG: hypothetical protein AVDCRST_MAG56-3690 [uncultured Cytophagales bacterium]|uniref:Uncharacterized protein n=1 Tax=uncultured Cytophagales bacterium TaxID=158755 RepID=A0A6J4JIU4_9SPHI|nr:MAG: hypothetical protein AVDCRST_MAG56-3690 [uncultured Cytophagales bacterium]
MNLEGFDLEDDQIAAFHQSLARLRQRYSVEVTDCDQIPGLFGWIDALKAYQVLGHYKDFQIINVFNASTDGAAFQIVNVYVSYVVNTGKGHMQEFGKVQSIGWAELPVDFGYVLITAETVADKVLDFFLHRDVDFEAHKAFSDRFLLLASDKAAVKKHFTAEWLDCIAASGHVEIEIKGNKLVASYPEAMTVTTTLAIAGLVEKAKRTILAE